MVTTALKSFRWCEGLVRAICEIDREFPGYLLTQSKAERQMMVVILRARDSRSGKKMPLAELGRRIRSDNKKVLLRKNIPDCPDGLFGAMNKVGWRIMAADRYGDLIDLLREPAAAKVLRHAKRITPLTIHTLKSLDPIYRNAAVLANLRSDDDISELKYVIAVAKRFQPTATDREMARSLDHYLKKRPIEHGYRTGSMTQWVGRRLRKSKFPTPPWEGTNSIRPLKSIAEIGRIAQEFRNCIADSIPSIIVDSKHYYVYRGRINAIISLERDPALGWGVGEILGQGNRQVSGDLSAEIRRAFGKAGFGEYLGWESLGFGYI